MVPVPIFRTWPHPHMGIIPKSARGGGKGIEHKIDLFWPFLSQNYNPFTVCRPTLQKSLQVFTKKTTFLTLTQNNELAKSPEYVLTLRKCFATLLKINSTF